MSSRFRFRRAGRRISDVLTNRKFASTTPSPAVATQDIAANAALADALLAKAQHDRARIEFRGKFEGLWTDRLDAPELVARRLRAGQIDGRGAELLTQWIEHGFVVLPGVVDEAVCEALKEELSGAFRDGDDRLHVLEPGQHLGRPLKPNTNMSGMRVIDVHVYLESARPALFNDAVTDFLRVIFDAPPLLLQGITFEEGSQQGFHQDTAYVVVDPPLALAASWLALEDVVEGAGEVMYIDGSHRLEDHLFSGKFKAWHPSRDGSEAHDRYLAGLVARSEAAGLAKRRFLARKGDVLIWSADLAHCGTPVTVEGATRRSLVGHFCPEWAVPNYFDLFPERAARVPCRGGFYSSMHYPLSDSSVRTV